MTGRRRLKERFAFASHAVHNHRRRPVLELLEGRALLATFTVNSLGHIGGGSGDAGDLRYCINQASADDQANTIVFDSTVFKTPQTITLSGGELELKDTEGTQTITAPAAGVTLSGGGKTLVFQVGPGVTASISGLTISDGDGSGVVNDGTATLTDCTISGNTSEGGGGVCNSGTVTLTNCTLSGNTASNPIYSYYEGTVDMAAGGGVFNSGTATLTGCTISGNNAAGGGGGGVYNSGPGYNSGPAKLTMSNCTVVGNSGVSYDGEFELGGGAGVENKGTAILTHCTVSGNFAGGGLLDAWSDSGALYATATLTDTIVAGNTDFDISGSNFSGSSNLIGTGGSEGLASGVDGNIVLTNLTSPGLAPLGNYGGPTQTMPLLPGSPALGAGSTADYPDTTTPITTDQRGEPLDSPNPDIGAFQSQGFILTPVAGSTPQSTATGTAFDNPLGVTVTAKNPIEPVAGGILTFTAPASGPRATLSATTATIGSGGSASITAKANATAGSYTVAVSGGGAATADFALTNSGKSGSLVPLNFSGLSDPTVTYGTSSVIVSGTLDNSSQAPVGESVVVTLDGIKQSATIGSGGAFSTTFITTGLTVANSPDTIAYAYASDGTFASASTTSTLTVKPAPLTVTATNKSKVYGAAMSALTYTYTGLVNGNTSATFTGSLATTAIATSDVSNYGITQGALAATGNYTIGAFKPGTLSITKANQKIAWATPAAIVYGTPLGTTQLDAKVSVVGPAPAGALTYSPASGTVLKAGVGQTLTVAVAGTTDYNPATYSVAITVKPAPLAVTANNLSMTRGGAVPALTYTYTGLESGDKIATFSGSLVTTATSSSPAGGYPITEGTLKVTGNYTIGTFKAGTLTVKPAPPKATATNLSVSAGGAVSALIETYAGQVNDGGTDPLGVKSGTAAESVRQAPTAEIQPLAPGRGVPTGRVVFQFAKKHRNKVTVKPPGTA